MYFELNDPDFVRMSLNFLRQQPPKKKQLSLRCKNQRSFDCAFHTLEDCARSITKSCSSIKLNHRRSQGRITQHSGCWTVLQFIRIYPDDNISTTFYNMYIYIYNYIHTVTYNKHIYVCMSLCIYNYIHTFLFLLANDDFLRKQVVFCHDQCRGLARGARPGTCRSSRWWGCRGRPAFLPRISWDGDDH